MIKRLLDILLLFREYLLFAALLTASLALLATSTSPQMQAIRSFTVLAVGFLQDTFAAVPNYLDLARENRALRELNLTLSDEVSRLREARLENLRLRRLLAFREEGPRRYIAASVVGKNLQLLRNTMTVDVGERDGVGLNMPVVCEVGLVGKTVATSSRYAVVQTLLHADMRVSAKVQRSRVDGILRWTGGPTLALQNVAKTLDVQVGDLVITSEYSSIFPPGIRIGVVEATRQIPGSLFRAVDVRPDADFFRLEEVFVLAAPPDTARLSVEQQLQP